MYNFSNLYHTSSVERKNDRMNKNNKKVVCRPCKEENNWEIQAPDGHVYQKHYQTKAECVKQARKYAQEFACELVVEDKNQQ
jgi:hypothetical protein